MAHSPSRSPDIELGDSVQGRRDSADTQREASGDPATAGMAQARKADERDLPPSKRARTMVQDAEGRNRQRRLFGVLTKTLTKFQEDTKKETEASKRRQAVEDRLAAKRKEENDAIEAKTGKERERRNMRFEVIKKEDERSAFIAIYQTRKTTKLHLANFLCTADEASTSSNTPLGNLKPPALPELPHAIAPAANAPSAGPSTSSAHKPLYYLPYKLLPWQADKIDGQVEDMRTELDKEDAEWTEELAKRDAELTELRAKLDEINANATREAGGEVRRTRLRHERDEENQDDSGDASLPRRAPLPEREGDDNRDEMDEGDASNPYKDEKEDIGMAGVADEEDVVAY